MEILIPLFVVSFLVNILLLVFFIKKDLYCDRLLIKIATLERNIISLQSKYGNYVSATKYNDLVKKANERIRQLKNTNLSYEDCKRLKYYIHPDKHNGKTNDLFIKVSKVIDDSSK